MRAALRSASPMRRPSIVFIPVVRRVAASSGIRNGSGRTRCGATVRISGERSAADSQARPHSPCAEVAQPAVHQLRAPAARPVREVAPLEQRDREAAARRVERDARAGDPAADHDDVDDLAAGERLDVGRPASAVEGGAHAATRPIGSRLQVAVDRVGELRPRVQRRLEVAAGGEHEPAHHQLDRGGERERRHVLAHRAVGLGEHGRGGGDRHPLHPAEPLGHVRQEQLGVHVHQPREQRVLGHRAGAADDHRHDALARGPVGRGRGRAAPPAARTRASSASTAPPRRPGSAGTASSGSRRRAGRPP